MATDRPYDPNDPSTWQDPGTQDPRAARRQLLQGVDQQGAPSDPSQNTPDPSLPPLPTNIQTATGAGGTDIQSPVDDPGGASAPPGPLDPGPNPDGREKKTPVPNIPTPAPGPETTVPPAYTPPSSIGPDPGTAANTAKLRAFMLSQLDSLSTPTDENDPALAPSITAYRNQSQRDQQSLRDQQAERFYAMGQGGGAGLSSGGFNTALTQDAEAAGASRANFTGSLVYNASQAKRQQLQAMLQTAVNSNDTESAQQIQSQIALIDAHLKSQGLNNSNQNFNDSLAARYAELKAQMNRDQILAALGR